MKKVYFVEWKDSWLLPYSTVVKAKDKAQAWAKVRRRHPLSTKQIVRIEEVD